MACSYAYINGIGREYYYYDCCGNYFVGTTTQASTGIPYIDFSKPNSQNFISGDIITQPCPTPTPTKTTTQTPTPTATRASTPTPTRTPTQTPSRSGLPQQIPVQQINECDVFTNYPLELTCRVITPASYLGNDGELKINIAGGTPPYQIFWSNGSRQDTISKLSAGTYSVQVVDYYGDYTATTVCTLPQNLPPCKIGGSATYLEPSTIYAIVLNDDGEISRKINNLSYSSVTNPTIGFNFNNTNVALASSPIGYSGKTSLTPYIPNYNDTVRMQIPEIPVSPADLEFDPTFDCKMWYYTSNTEYTTSQFINEIPNLIPLTINNTNISSVSTYYSDFNFNYIGRPSFYYLVWDFRGYPDLKEFKVFAKGLTSFTANTIQSVLPNPIALPFWVDFGDGNSKYFSGGTYTNFTTGYTSPFTGEIKFKTTNLNAFKQIVFSSKQVESNPSIISGLTFTTKELGKLSGLTNLQLCVPDAVDEVSILFKPHLSGTPSELPRNLQILFAGNTSLIGNVSGFPTTIQAFRIGTNNLSGNTSDFPSGILNVLQIFGENTIGGDTSGLPRQMTILDISGNNTISGDTSGLPSGLTYLHLFGFNTISGNTLGLPRNLGIQPDLGDCSITGFNTITGDVADLPTLTRNLAITGLNSITGDCANLPRFLKSIYLGCEGNSNCGTALFGDVANLPTGTTFFSHPCTGTTVSGDLANIPTGITAFNITGNNTIEGDLANLPFNLWTVTIKGLNKINNYTAGKVWRNPMNRLDVAGNYTGLTNTMIDNLLIDLSAVSWQGRSLATNEFSPPEIQVKTLTPPWVAGSIAAQNAYNSLTGQGVSIIIS